MKLKGRRIYFKSLQHSLGFGFKYAASEISSPNTQADCVWIIGPTQRKNTSEKYFPEFRRNKKNVVWLLSVKR